MTVNCCWLLPNFELKFCTKLILRIIPQIIVPITVLQVSPIDQCWVHRRGDAQVKNATKNLDSSTKMRKSFANFGNKPDPLVSKGRQCFFEISSMPYGHRVGTNEIRTDPPIVSIDSNFLFSDAVRVVFVRQFVHLATYFFIAANVKTYSGGTFHHG